MYERYAKLRDENQTNDNRVAKEAGISPVTLYAWKNGEYTPKAETIMKIAKVFGVGLDYFYA